MIAARVRRTAVALCAAAFCLAVTACGVVSALSPQAYLDDVGVKSVDLAAVAPGTYTGDYTLALPPGAYAKNRHFNVAVTIDGNAAVDVTINEPSHLSSWNAAATQLMNNEFREMADRIAAARAIPVDGVSGATYSSMAFLKAVEKAVAP